MDGDLDDGHGRRDHDRDYGTYATNANLITITTPSYPAACGIILSPYTTTYSISGSGTTLRFGGDPATYIRQ